MESTIVIKVKFGETLRRFNASITGEELDLTMDGLRRNINSLFNFPCDSELTLTYLDEDGDVVTLADDNDLEDIGRQHLNPLRISVTLITERSFKSHSSSGSSTPMRSPRVEPSLKNLDGSVSEILKSVPEALLEKISKLSSEMGSNSPGSPPVYSEILDSLSKIGLYHLKEVVGTKSVPSVNTTGTQVNKDDNNVKFDGTKQAPNSKGKDLDAATHGNKFSVGSSIINPSPNSLGVGGFSIKDTGSTTQKLKEKSNGSYMGWKSLGSILLLQEGVSGTKDAAVESESSFGSQVGVNSFGDCPFLGVPIDNSASFIPGRPYAPRTVPFKKSHSHNGVRCDGCGVHPITGPRFKSKVKEDYDLCSICFPDIGNDMDYIRMDRPVNYRHPFSLKGLCKPPVRGMYPPKLPSQVLRGSASRSKLNCHFVQDVSIIDGTVMAPSTPFTKIWRVKNNGNVVWPSGSQLVWIGGDVLSKILSAEVEIPADGCPVGTEIDIAVDFVAPENPGRYISYWRMATPSGQKFGQRVWVLIEVEAVNERNMHSFNLNMIPFSGAFMDPQKEDVSVPQLVDSIISKTDNVEMPAGLVEPVTAAPSNPDQELNFPINDTLLVGGTSSNPVPLTASSLVGTSTLSEVAAPIATSPVQTFSTDVDTNELTLLKELEEMGFKQVDLNKEILRRNAYDLEQSVDDLCDVQKEWDTILVELQEMGFSDKKKNKIVLEKNNGSIKRTVMDLIADTSASGLCFCNVYNAAVELNYPTGL
ncbi:Agamous MADS-box protein [Heracleum sosnowskyi]|uniref:Agamous MADS-box protein n=1 Tax=Heracleum sosnowskyi TaxID=360622 RepID=A0AAD8M544_9APIA|nr:Agamous MADS-box protein [Heracleum sosnowskyi]